MFYFHVQCLCTHYHLALVIDDAPQLYIANSGNHLKYSFYHPYFLS